MHRFSPKRTLNRDGSSVIIDRAIMIEDTYFRSPKMP
jgi:ATP-dependent exoDNAse (exonuclease V) alpha subunit